MASSLDRRTDIWSFGCVLYEMLTGRAPFAGDTISDTLAAILEREPDWTMLPADTPAADSQITAAVSGKGSQDDGSIRRPMLDWRSTTRSRLRPPRRSHSRRRRPVASRRWRSRRWPAVAVIAALVAWILMRPAPAAPVLPSRFAIVPPPGPAAERVRLRSRPRPLARRPAPRLPRRRGSDTAGSPVDGARDRSTRRAASSPVMGALGAVLFPR